MSGRPDRPRWVLASANPNKAAEMTALLDDLVTVEPRPPEIAEVVEDATDLVGNARLKARAVSDATAMVAVADDTGLFVDALGGAPGVRSARFAGDDATDADNVSLLLSRLDGVPSTERSARFVTVVVVVDPEGAETVVEGRAEGSIALVPRGGSGFGYDPVFIPVEGDGRTFAEMTAEEKHALSHRGRAIRQLRDRLA